MPAADGPVLTVRGVTLGTGMPAVIVPVVTDDPGRIGALVHHAAAAGADMVEWRCDPAIARHGIDAVRAVAGDVRAAAGETPVLVTVRTADEGGAWDGGGDDLLRAYQDLLDTGTCDLLDVQMLSDPAVAAQAMGAAHEAEVPVVGSHHRFDGTPSTDAMIEVLARIGEAGAEVAKLAVMPHTPFDVLALLEATLRSHDHLACPVITMSMGGPGGISRLAGALTGSAATFAALDDASAPGQLPLDVVREALTALGD